MYAVYEYDSEMRHHVAITRLKCLGYDYMDEPNGDGTGCVVADDVHYCDDRGIRAEIDES